MGDRLTKPNAVGIDDANTVMTPQGLEQLGRQMGSYGYTHFMIEWMWCVIADKHNEARFCT